MENRLVRCRLDGLDMERHPQEIHAEGRGWRLSQSRLQRAGQRRRHRLVRNDMRARLIVDSLSGLNPDYNPPVRSSFATDEEFYDAQALYDVPPQHIIPAGTELTGSMCWVHCYPEDNTGFRIDPKSGRRIPTRLGVGTVRAVPVDAACEAALLKHVQHAAKA